MNTAASGTNMASGTNAASDPTCLLRSYADGVLNLTLNRPAARNAMSLAMVNELLDALRQAEANPSVRIIVLRGAGGHFCAGGDIKDMVAARMRMMADDGDGDVKANAEHDPIAETNARFGHLCLAFARTPLALIVAMEGSVMGGGFGLACVADVALAAASANFRLPETSLGIVPAQIAPFLVERLGYSEAKRLAVTGGAISADEAQSLRLIHGLYDDANALEVAVQSTINKIRQCAPGALARTKKLVARARVEAPEALIDDAAKLFSQAIQSAEGMEGSAAFMQKRKPQWAAV